jgi:hypothetical protein
MSIGDASSSLLRVKPAAVGTVGIFAGYRVIETTTWD